MSNRDGRAAKHGDRTREYWSKRGYCWPWGRIGKWLTHNKERAAARREEQRLVRQVKGDADAL